MNEINSDYEDVLKYLLEDIDNYDSKRYYRCNIHWNSLCLKINKLIDKIGYVDKKVHYFRNKLNRAPSTLNDLLNINKNLSKEERWVLMEPSKSLFHMYGKDGEYNLKFVSADGNFEAVYNKEGVLLTEKNDPINMGTYNYASPEDVIKHTIYDVNPYIKWGNVPGVERPSLTELDDNLFRFNHNQEAQKRYEYIKLQLEQQ